jgi:hypothetical protein
MAKFILMGFFVFSGLSAHASCNSELAIAAGRYLMELEKAKMYQHQDGGVCKVLEAEYRKCSKIEKERLARSVSITELLGNICMPHLPAPPATN